VHRIGRTGRADKKGEARTFITEKEVANMSAIEKLMKFKIKISPLPKKLEISEILIEEEKPKIKMKIIEPKVRKKEETGGGAFHEKSDKNKKTNQKIHRAEALKIKYNKPKSVRGKKR
jgi:ATP-dependent RNA helicase RhlE